MKSKNTVTLRVRALLPDGIDVHMFLVYVRATLWNDTALMNTLAPIDQAAIAAALQDEKAAVALVQKVTDYE